MSLTDQRLWGDRRAERARAEADKTRAAGDLELARAQAEAARLAAGDESARRQQLAKDEARDRRELRRARRRQDRAARWRRRALVVGDTAGDLVRGLPLVAGAVACVAPTVLAFRGQLAYAQGPMQLGPLAPLLPLMLEGAAWFLAWRRHRAVRAGEPLGWLTPGVWALALIAAGLQVWHGVDKGDVQVGVTFGLASLVGFGLVELLARHDRAAARQDIDRIGCRRWVRFPHVAFGAWSRMVELGPAVTAAEAWRQGWLDRYGVEPGATRGERLDGRATVRALDWGRRQAGVVRGDDDEDGDDPGDEDVTDEDLVAAFAARLDVAPVDLDPADEDEPGSPGGDDLWQRWERMFDPPAGGQQPGGDQRDEDLDEPAEQHEQHDGDELPAWLDLSRALDERVELAAVHLDKHKRGRRPIGRRRVADLLGLDENDTDLRKAWAARLARLDGQENAS